ncbi:N-acetylneuraminate lyase isoform X1 [Nasonia vitripennis]|uniref:N-acetylneuraminate lyase n=1 Tax=Nasonia vitripennis TaxID=7425 RepID=A0A7M7IZJ8_NASVI|nr:N-acetylneuraminate lyase isoform X1 [Nasonia vitripennis]XP_016840832.1 N-acetylneuraminate lyase isoform X1 [Nasonia vitripennis]XP_032454945.1 N-acetylneuraminate lyase isoform X1 [Nasonia vitripennis]XP_032454946.1 N-acetylneuraminate lyase isoform X1 [Nasonia vitripennis]
MTKIKFTYKGLIVPVFTPFNNDASQSLNLSIIPQYAKFLESKKIAGVLVNGTSGEGTSLTVNERKKVAEVWAEAVKETKQHLMIQVGGTSLKDVKELAEHAENLGADSILCLPELYFKPTTVNDLVEYLARVGKSAPKTPLFYYDFPKASMVNIDMAQVFALIGEKVPTFAGIKTDLERGLHAKHVNNDFAIFLAGDMLMIGGCASGMESYIMTSLNFIPEPAFALIEYGKGNYDLHAARKSQEYINRIAKDVTRYGTWTETMKIAMNLSTDIFVGPPRAPLKLLSRQNMEAMEQNLSQAGIKTNKAAIFQMYNCN